MLNLDFHQKVFYNVLYQSYVVEQKEHHEKIFYYTINIHEIYQLFHLNIYQIIKNLFNNKIHT
jgi:hypothetical protein